MSQTDEVYNEKYVSKMETDIKKVEEGYAFAYWAQIFLLVIFGCVSAMLIYFQFKYQGIVNIATGYFVIVSVLGLIGLLTLFVLFETKKTYNQLMYQLKTIELSVATTHTEQMTLLQKK